MLPIAAIHSKPTTTPKAAGPSGPALVQQKVGTTADGTGVLTITFDAPLTAGNSVIACISCVSGATVGQPGLVDGGAESLGNAVSRSGTGIKSEIWFVHNVMGGETALQVDTDLPVRLSASVAEFSGVADFGAESNGVATGTASDTVEVEAESLSAGALAVAIGSWTADDYLSGPTNGYTRLMPTGGGAVFQEAAYKVLGAPGVSAVGWTLSVGINWAAVSAIFTAE